MLGLCVLQWQHSVSLQGTCAAGASQDLKRQRLVACHHASHVHRSKLFEKHFMLPLLALPTLLLLLLLPPLPLPLLLLLLLLLHFLIIPAGHTLGLDQ
jgi:hypothetical protein